VNRVVAEGELDAAVESLLAGLRGLSRRSLRVAKQALRLARPRPDGDALEAAERLYLDRLLHDPDAIEGLRAFLEKRPPRWPRV
jgi:enoyl-CoA hydratase/carnithine racemase